MSFVPAGFASSLSQTPSLLTCSLDISLLLSQTFWLQLFPCVQNQVRHLKAKEILWIARHSFDSSGFWIQSQSSELEGKISALRKCYDQFNASCLFHPVGHSLERSLGVGEGDLLLPGSGSLMSHASPSSRVKLQKEQGVSVVLILTPLRPVRNTEHTLSWALPSPTPHTKSHIWDRFPTYNMSRSFLWQSQGHISSLK